MLVVGVDVGTQGARALAVGPDGGVAAQARRAFARADDPALPAGWCEQSPEEWWRVVVLCLAQLATDLGSRTREIRALAVAVTSGTICILDGAGRPLLPAIMYSDMRAGAEVAAVNEFGAELTGSLGYRFNTSFGLPKLLWLARRRPAAFASARYLAHAGDFLMGRLTGEYGITDETQALKTGYDLLHERWPAFIERNLGIPFAKLPRVVRAGTVAGSITPSAAAQTGLPRDILVTVGATDGVAGQIAAGAVQPGEWVSSLGTTLILKGVSTERVLDPAGRVYCHRHPDGFWLPGAASNVGGGALNDRFPGADLSALDQDAATLAPSGLLIYPLLGQGERFPFVHQKAGGFLIGDASSEACLYTGYLEGVAYTERLGYEALAALGAPCGDAIYACGGAVRSDVWLQIRADVLGREMLVTEHPEAAYGAAIIAAARMVGRSVGASAQAMARVRRRVSPQPERMRRYDALYQRFVAACRDRGWLEAQPGAPASTRASTRSAATQSS